MTDNSADNNIERGRADLAAWEASKPDNFWEADCNIQRVMQMYLGDERFRGVWPELCRTGELAAGSMDRFARDSNRDENLPCLSRHDGIGRRNEDVVFHPSYHELGAQIWSTGVLAVQGEPGGEVLGGGLAYLIDHNGEAGHACPVACTAGLIKLLQRVGSEEQRQRYLPRLLERDYGKRLHAAQFVTEVQGGSDVGTNACVATPATDRPGHFRITGEKWFCSVADAQLFVLTARPEDAEADGTRGLGLFLVPRFVDGQANRFSIRRLKYKLGTRSMASGEMDFDGALAEPLGLLHRGFKNLIGIVLDTSRVHNAVAACGGMRRAYVEAHTFAAHRVAFDRRIIEHPMLQERLARMKVLTTAAIASTFRILDMTDRVAGEDADDDLIAARRTHVNINKYWTAIKCTEVVRDGIEVLGGNGTIEEFSVLPRLYRDAIVVESWEGTHNTLCAQVLRDFAQRGMHRQWLSEVRSCLKGLSNAALKGHRERAAALHEEVTGRIDRLHSSEDYASQHIRHVVDRMCVLNAYVSLLRELDWELGQGISSEKGAIVEIFRLLHVDGVDPMDHDELPGLYGQVLATM
jgi:alkylation response protein AidB-like acyl-CoA dehydrogenase